MFTHNYKGAYIHGYCAKPECKVTCFGIDPARVFKSYRAAQLAITRATREHDAAMAVLAARLNADAKEA